MFCPKCGSSQNDELKFCKLCGANLFAVRQVVDNREAVEKFDWTRTWVAEMFMSPSEIKRRKEEIEAAWHHAGDETLQRNKSRRNHELRGHRTGDLSLHLYAGDHSKRQRLLGGGPQSSLDCRCATTVCRNSSHNKRCVREQETRRNLQKGYADRT